jgi:CelD/BcsL family acetyltransferase involved in cellulose biosynthesis
MQEIDGLDRLVTYREICADGVSVSCYDTVPAFIRDELDRLYQHLNSSLAHHIVERKARQAKTYVAHRDGEPVAILLFRQRRRAIEVLNEMIQINREEIERFARFVFKKFSDIQVISFSLIEKNIEKVSLPHQQHGHSEDIVIKLPETPEHYLASLGAKMRHNIRHNLKALPRDHAGFSFHTFDNEAIDPRHIHDLIALKRKNIANKKMAFGVSPEEVDWLVAQARSAGLLTVALLGDRLCGGSLSLRVGSHYFAHMLAYEPEFEKYSLGTVCSYLSMREKIMRGATEAHLSWGRNQYKFKLLGVQRDMANLDVYRSRSHYLRHAPVLIRNAVATRMQEFKIRLLDSEQSTGTGAWLARGCVGIARTVKRSAFGLARPPHA